MQGNPHSNDKYIQSFYVAMVILITEFKNAT